MSKIIITVGLSLVIFGGVIFLLEKYGLSVGNVPGDFIFRKGNMTIYLPMMTCLLVSILLTVIFMFLKK